MELKCVLLSEYKRALVSVHSVGMLFKERNAEVVVKNFRVFGGLK
jgi:hypothetical protein